MRDRNYLLHSIAKIITDTHIYYLLTAFQNRFHTVIYMSILMFLFMCLPSESQSVVYKDYFSYSPYIRKPWRPFRFLAYIASSAF
jgi:hypothetical protein